MSAFANVAATPAVDGLYYAQGVALGGSEADLGVPAAVLYGEAVLAVVTLAVVGVPGTSYVVMQTDLGDGTWVDVAWCQSSAGPGTFVFALSAGVLGTCSAVAMTRASGTAPGGTGANQVVLGGRLRFVGKVSSGSSSSPGPASSTVTVKYKLQGLR